MPIQSYVDANYRYIAAHQEINARIAQRQQALTLYVTLIVSLLAALVALQPVSEEAPVEWLVFGFSLASICYAFLNLKTERAITNLRRFLSALERLGDAHRSLPSYNTDPQWSEAANRARRLHDFAAALLVAGSNGIGFAAAAGIYPARLALHPVIVATAGLLALVAFGVLLLSPRWGYRPEAGE